MAAEQHTKRSGGSSASCESASWILWAGDAVQIYRIIIVGVLCSLVLLASFTTVTCVSGIPKMTAHELITC